MKTVAALAVIVLLFTTPSFSQDVIKLQSCKNDLISRQVDSLKALFAKQDLELVREASITMESDYEMPVIMQLTQGAFYHFVFIGEYSSKLYETRMYDWNEKEVVFQQKRWGDVDGNIISYTYVPKFTEYHMMKNVQVNKQKKKGLCGYVMLFRKKAAASN